MNEFIDDLNDDNDLDNVLEPEPDYDTTADIPSEEPEELFDDQQLINKQELRHSPFYTDIVELINASTLSARCKRTLKMYVKNHYNRDVVLANFQSLIDPKLDIEIDLLVATTGIWPDDAKNPDYVNIIQNIQSHQTPWITRAIGKDRERIRQDTTTHKHETESINNALIPPPDHKPKGLFNR